MRTVECSHCRRPTALPESFEAPGFTCPYCGATNPLDPFAEFSGPVRRRQPARPPGAVGIGFGAGIGFALGVILVVVLACGGCGLLVDREMRRQHDEQRRQQDAPWGSGRTPARR